MFRESLFQHSYPWAELKIVGSADEKMKVIGHYHISADSDITNPVRLLGEPDECRVHRIGREQFPPLVCTERDEEQSVVSENPPEARRQSRKFWQASVVAGCMWKAQCRCSLAARDVAHRATATEVGMRLMSWNLPRKKHATAIFGAYSCR